MTAQSSKDIIHSERQIELDMLKVIDIFMMIFMHLQEVVFSCSYNDRTFIQNSWGILFCCNAFYLFGPFSFLFSMGCTIPFSRHNEPKQMMRRGFFLIAAWFGLNLLRMIPHILLMKVYQEAPFWQNYFRFIWAYDVLFFAGAFFIIFGWLKKMNQSMRNIAFIFAGLFAIAQLAGDFGRFLPVWTHRICGGFVAIEHVSCFPLFNWGFVVVLGIALGMFMQRYHDKARFYSVSFILGAAATAVLLTVLWRSGVLTSDVLLRNVSNPLSCHTANVISVSSALGMVALFLGMAHSLSFALTPRIRKAVSCVSKRLLNVYIVHWLILIWLGFIPWMRNGQAGAGKIGFVTVALYLVSFYIVIVYERLMRALKERRKVRSAS